MEYGKYETLARAGYSGAARPQGDWQTSAALTRQQYDDWRTRYLLRVARLADLGENNSLMNAQLARVGGLATSSLRTAQMAQDNQMARYGVSRPDNPNRNTLGFHNSDQLIYIKRCRLQSKRLRHVSPGITYVLSNASNHPNAFPAMAVQSVFPDGFLADWQKLYNQNQGNWDQ